MLGDASLRRRLRGGRRRCGEAKRQTGHYQQKSTPPPLSPRFALGIVKIDLRAIAHCHFSVGCALIHVNSGAITG
jgi:hypothetical protein